MPVFVFLIIISIGMYFFYKTKFFRSQKPYEKRWFSAKSSIALGFFVFFFGLNQLITWDTLTTKIVGTIFLIIGGYSAFQGFRLYRHYSPLALQEAEDTNK